MKRKPNIAIYTGSGNIVWRNIARNRPEISLIELKNFQDFYFNELAINKSIISEISALKDQESILLDLKKLLPILSRHFNSLHDLDLALTELVIVIMGLRAELIKASIDFVIISTSSSHHLDTVVCELAARYAGIPQVFHNPIGYLNGEALEILPLIQLHGIQDRRVFPVRINSSDDSKQLSNLQSREFKAAKLTESPSKVPSHVFTVSLGKFLYFSLRKSVKELRSRQKIYQVYGSQYLESYSFVDRYKLLIKQRQNYIFLDSLIETDRHIAKKKLQELQKRKEVALVIYAQYTPESSVFPDGGEYYNFLRVALSIRAKGFSGTLFYKEHPAMRYYFNDGRFSINSSTRSIKYYERLKELDCIFLSDEIDLRDSCSVIPVTSTGTIAIERAQRNLPTIVLGHPWYWEADISISLEEFLDMPLNGAIDKSYVTNWSEYVQHKISKKFLSQVPGQLDSKDTRLKFQNQYELFLDRFEELTKHNLFN